MKTLESWHGPAYYEIKVNGCFGSHWSDWFDGMQIEKLDEECTVISGPVRDQSALHGLLNRIRDMGMHLVSIERNNPKC